MYWYTLYKNQILCGNCEHITNFIENFVARGLVIVASTQRHTHWLHLNVGCAAARQSHASSWPSDLARRHCRLRCRNVHGSRKKRTGQAHAFIVQSACIYTVLPCQPCIAAFMNYCRATLLKNGLVYIIYIKKAL